MLFNSIEYLFLFLPIVSLLYFLLPHKFRWVLLLIASYFFYMYWRPEYAILLWLSTTIDYIAGIKMDDAPNKILRKRWMWVSVGSNLSLLFFFKYLDFFNESIRSVLAFIGINYPVPTFNILLPVGISFYTFQSLSYTLDVYWKRIKSERHYGIFAIYVCFFPQLVAGPIERAGALLPQFKTEHKFDLERIISGCKLIVWGLFKKLIIADVLGNYVNLVYANHEAYNGFNYWVIAFFFMYQLYLDFSAYSDIAIGSARIIGFDLMSNFERPLLANSVEEVWKRWHISLTTWIFDYLYRPLRKITKGNYYLTLILLFTIIGIWHGASYNFVIYGILTGLLYTITIATSEARANLWQKIPLIGKNITIYNLLSRFCTIILFALVLIPFRSPNFKVDIYVWKECYKSLIHFNIADISIGVSMVDKLNLIIGFGVLTFLHLNKHFKTKFPFDCVENTLLRFILYYLVLFMLIIFGNREKIEFLYFQF